MTSSPQRSVALLIETSNEYARGLLRGILRYQQEHERWSIDLDEQQRGAEPPRWLKRFTGDGIIARVETDAIARAVKATKLPAIDVSAARHLPGIPWVETDDEAIAEVAVDHFCTRGLKDLAFCGEIEFNWARWRGKSFRRVAESRGLSVQSFDVGNESTGTTWPRERRRLATWLGKLPEPCGLMAAYDSLARRVLEICDHIDRKVPESIAVMGVDNDPLLCQLARPPLTSVIPDAERAGYVAAERLDRLMDGHLMDGHLLDGHLLDGHLIDGHLTDGHLTDGHLKSGQQTGGAAVADSRTLLPPLGIATRRSTDVLAVDDSEVSAAAQYILAHACEGVRVNDVVAHSSLTRRVLETRFKAATGQTPHQLIVATRLAKAEQLLRETPLSLSQIAQRVGVEHAEYLSVMFRKHHGVTPGAYRNA